MPLSTAAGIKPMLNTIETYTLDLIGEDPDSPDVFTDDSTGMKQIRDSINDAIEEICMVTGSHVRDYYLALRQNRHFYRLETQLGSMAWIKDVWLTGQKRRLEQTDLTRLSTFDPRWLYSTGSPQSYFQIGLKYIGVWPAPATDTDTLEISMVMIPARYEDGDEQIKLRKTWQWAAAHYATGEYYASRGDAKTAIYHHNSYLAKIGLNLKYPQSQETIYQLYSAKEPWPKETG